MCVNTLHFFLENFEVLGLSLGVVFYWMNNLPEYLAHQYYELISQMECPKPGLYYDQALAKARAGNLEDVKDDIKKARNDYPYCCLA